MESENKEERSLAAGEERVKFIANRKGTIDELLKSEKQEKLFVTAATELADAMFEIEQAGAAPVLPDGKVGGNGSCLISLNSKPYLLVTKTGKQSGRMSIKEDVCIVENFNMEKWTADYYSAREDIRPTSDTPMHYATMNLQLRFEFTTFPKAGLHGHALETEEKAKKANVPISREETLFSTPPDTEALLNLIENHPYPENKVFIRNKHGFFILGKDMNDVVDILRECVVPFHETS